MNSKTAHEVCLNLRDPLDAKKRIHLTARSIRLITIMFGNTSMDVITLHSHLLRIAYMRGCLHEKKYISMSDVITYMLSQEVITLEQAERVSAQFDVEKDSQHEEVESMKRIIRSLSR